jgi:hypothetical protein
LEASRKYKKKKSGNKNNQRITAYQKGRTKDPIKDEKKPNRKISISRSKNHQTP